MIEKKVHGNKGKHPWNYHLMAKTDERVRMNTQKSGLTNRGKIAWNKDKKMDGYITKSGKPYVNYFYGKTKENCEPLRIGAEKLSILKKGKPSPRMLGDNNPSKRLDVREKNRIAHLGHKPTDETRKKSSESHLTSEIFQKVVHSKERAKKISDKLIGHLVSLEVRIHNRRTSQAAWNDPIYREKESGKNSHFYIDGRSKDKDKNEYAKEWSGLLREEVKKRDSLTCYLCKKENVVLSVHHIDYDKQNCDPSNLISLCKRCHAKTNKNREYWKNFFQNQSFIRYSPTLREIVRAEQKWLSTTLEVD